MRTFLVNLKQCLVSARSEGTQGRAGQAKARLWVGGKRPGQSRAEETGAPRQTSVKTYMNNEKQDPRGSKTRHTGRRNARRQNKHMAKV